MLVEPGFFRTDLLTHGSTTYAAPSIEDYAERTGATVAAWTGMNGKQGGDPARLAAALVRLADSDAPPMRFAAGADAVKTFEDKADALRSQAEAHRALSALLGFGDRDDPSHHLQGTITMKNKITDEARPGISRRTLLTGGTALTALLLSGADFASANAARAVTTKSGITIKSVEFKNGSIAMAGNLYLPRDFRDSGHYPAIVAIHPGGGVKEQTAGLYARKLAEQGFVTLAFDASHQGASGGLPRYLDDPMRRVGDIYSAVDYLTSLRYVDAARVGALGICAGSGAAVKAASTERRIKAVGTVSAVDVGAASRKGWDGTASEADQIATLEAVAKERTAEFSGAAPVYVPYVPNVGDRSAPLDLQEAADYYLTPRGRHPNAPNKMLMTSASYMIAFTGFDRIDTLLTQPLMIIAGSRAGSLWHSRELDAKAASRQKELFIVDGATHMDLYDGPGVDIAMTKLSPFFRRFL